MKYINHLTLATGDCRQSPRSEMPDWVLFRLRPWLEKVIATGNIQPIPEIAGYGARAVKVVGLLMTVYALGSTPAPLVTLGVAHRSREAGDLWKHMVEHFGVAQGLAMPSVPWCAVALHPCLVLHSQAMEWLGDFERCVAWMWIMRRKT